LILPGCPAPFILVVMVDSVFTKIIKGEIPCQKVYEDDQTLAFMDIHPAQPGHTLVIPKRQVEFIWDMADEDYIALMRTVKKVGNRMRDVLRPKYVGILVEGISVPHVHIHIIPFATQAEFHHLGDQTAEPDYAALAEMAKKLVF
jgi:histidine triad (HIT) family protein